MNTFNTEQTEAINYNFGKFVTANAGSGKTTVLTQRFMEIILKKVELLANSCLNQLTVLENEVNLFNPITPNEIEKIVINRMKYDFKFDFIIVVSFTDNTSEDLIEKIKTKFVNQKQYSSNFKDTLSNIKRIIFEYLLENIHKFQISTIHSFCNNIISNSANKLNIDESYIKRDYYLEEISKKRASIIINDINLLKIFLSVKQIVINKEEVNFNRFHDIFLNLYKLNGNNYIHNLFQNFIWKISNGNSILKIEEAIKYFEYKIDTIKKNIELLNAKNDELKMYELALEFNTDIKYFAEVVFAILNSIHEENNFINFDNQIYKTYKFLSEPKNAKFVAEKIEYLLIDEFQDTDLIQYSIFKYLSDSNPDINLFFVGDPKQSIYRFRSSDVTVFNKAKEYFFNQKKVDTIVLNQSYRHTPVISSFVNTFFNIKFENFKNINKQYEYNNLVYPIGIYEDKNLDINKYINKLQIKNENSNENITLLTTGKIVYLTGFKTSESIEISKKLREKKKLANFHTDLFKNAQFLKLANFINEIVNTEKYKIEVKSNDILTKRKIEYKDIAVLSEKNIDSKNVADYFSYYNIPFQIKKTKYFYNLNEVKDSIDFLLFINNPNDNEAFISLLKSQFYGFSIETLFVLIEIFVKPNNLNENDFKYLSFWQKIQKLKFVDKSIVNEKLSAIASNFDINLGIFINNNNDINTTNNDDLQAIYSDLELIYNSTLKVIDYLELFILLKSKVFSSELLTMFFKSNENYQNFDLNNEGYYENLNKLINILHEIEQSGYVQFNDVLSQLKIKKYDDSEENILGNEDDNSVEFYTFHSSKGLEFPVVFILEPGGKESKTNNIEIEKEYGVLFENYTSKEEIYYDNLNEEISENLSENETIDNHKTNNINAKFKKYQQHFESFKENKHFKIQYEEYQTIDKLNLDYVAMTRAKNLLCFVFKASWEVNTGFHGSDTKKWDRLDFRKNISDMKFQNKERIFQDLYSDSPLIKSEEVIFEYYNSQSKVENDKSKQITTNIEIDYYFYDYINMIDEYEQNVTKTEEVISLEEIQLLKNNLNNSLNIYSKNLEVDKLNTNYKYQFESKYKTFSATKLMSLADNRNKYEYKYLLGLNDEQSLEVENNQNYEFDEFYLNIQKDNLIEKKSANNNENLNNSLEYIEKKSKVQNMEQAATFGKAFHQIIQNITDLFPDKKLDTIFLDSLIEETKLEYPNLGDEKYEMIYKILNNLSLSNLLDKIFEYPETIKTEFAIKIKFLPSHFHYLNGNIDLIYIDNDGNYNIIDWKTNSEKVGDSKKQYDLQRKLYTYMVQHLNPNVKVNFSLVYTQDIINLPEEQWETKFETDVIKEEVELEINKLITEILELESFLYE